MFDRLLLLEDDPVTQVKMRNVLQQYVSTVSGLIIVGSMKEAEAYKDIVDFAIVDLGLPDVSSPTETANIVAQWPCPVMVMSANDDLRVATLCGTLGMKFVPKGETMQTLHLVMANQFGLHERVRECTGELDKVLAAWMD